MAAVNEAQRECILPALLMVLLAAAPVVGVGPSSGKSFRAQPLQLVPAPLALANATGGGAALSAQNVSAGKAAAEPDHSGSPGSGGGHMVPRTEEHHGEFHWTYAEPGKWASEYADCNGEAQSPVNIVTSAVSVPEVEDEDFLAGNSKYRPLSGRSIKNNGHNVQVDGEFGTLVLPDGEYSLKQFHFHFPSEHEVNGKLAAGEMHMVHQKVGATGTNDLAVIGILFELEGSLQNDEDSAKELEFMRNLGFGKTLPTEGEELPIEGKVDLGVFRKVLAEGFFHYRGSLTTPPCSETVHWYVLQQPAAVSADMVASFKSLFPQPSNNRPVQTLHSRKVVFSEAALPQEFAKLKSGACHVGSAAAALALAAGLVA